MAEVPDKSKFALDNMGEPIDVKHHDTPERHTFGEAFLIPNDDEVQPTGAVASAGKSEKFARVDHVHVGSGGSGGVTDHGALTGLADDDHPQYLTNARGDALFLTPAEGNAAYDAAGAASTAVAAHAAAADPHAVYLRLAEILAGAGITVTDNGNGTLTIAAPNAPNAVQNTRAINTTAPLTGGGNLTADRTLDVNVFSGTVKGVVPAPNPASGKFLRDDATWQTVAGGITAHSALTGLTTGDDHTQYVKDAGDTMTGFLTLNADPTSALHAVTKQYVDARPRGILTRVVGTLAGASITTTATRLFTLPSVNLETGRQYRLVCGIRALYAASGTTAMRFTHAVAGVANTLNLDTYLYAATGQFNGGQIETLFTVTASGALTVGVDGRSNAAVTITFYNDTMWSYIQDLGPTPP